MTPRFSRYSVILSMLAALLAGGCASLLPSVDLAKLKFSLDRVSDVHVAGIDISKVESVDELNPFQVGRAMLAASRQRLPLDLTLHLKSANPVTNAVAARLVRMEWMLLLDGRETIHGTLEHPVTIAAGTAREIPLHLSLNMFDYFNEKSATDMLELALAFAGEGGGIPHGVALRVRPTIDTPLGPIRYGKAVLIESKSG